MPYKPVTQEAKGKAGHNIIWKDKKQLLLGLSSSSYICRQKYRIRIPNQKKHSKDLHGMISVLFLISIFNVMYSWRIIDYGQIRKKRHNEHRASITQGQPPINILIYRQILALLCFPDNTF